MLISYKPKQDHVKIIPLIPVSPEAKKVKLTRNQIQLLPGTNEISDDEWLVIKDHITMDLANKIIAPIEKTVTPSKRAPSGKAKSLKEMPAIEAVALVDSCTNPETLTKWYNEETREDVRLHIVNQMKEVKMEIPKLTTSTENDEDESDTDAGEQASPLDKMTKEQLISYAAEKKITVPPTGTAGEILAVIKKAEEKK
ncbi:MAG: hypothetical protein LBD55_02555 [Treponema sp.]|nr:hypothetical protein [Treponema sp.]